MPRRQTVSPLEQVLLTRHVVPWWLYFLLAIITWLALHYIAQSVRPFSQRGSEMVTLLHSFALVGQVLVPLALLCTGVAELFNRLSRRRRLDRLQHEGTSECLLEQLSWQEMCDLVELALHGEGYRSVSGAAKDTELMLQRGELRALLVTEYWRRPTLKTAMLQHALERAQALDAEATIVVCNGRINNDTRAFARRNAIRLIDRGHMQQWLQRAAKQGGALS